MTPAEFLDKYEAQLEWPESFNAPHTISSMREFLASLSPVAHSEDAKDAYGCHCDLEAGMTPDGCVIDDNRPQDCIHASQGKTKESCVYWMPIAIAAQDDAEQAGGA